MVYGCLVPHPPLIVPGVGDGTEIPSTREAYEKVAREVQEARAEVLVIFSPHTVMYSDYFHISPGSLAEGDFGSFGAPQAKFAVDYDSELAALIAKAAQSRGIAAGFLGEREAGLDWGVMVPLHFLSCRRIVRIGLSGLSYIDHYRFGMCVREAIDTLGRRAAIVASGDMSHKLGGSYGFSAYGVEHDAYVRECLQSGDLYRLMNIDKQMAANAAECGLRSIMMLAGAMDGLKVTSEVYSYEAPYGVGYLVASLRGEGAADSLLDALVGDRADGEDAFVRLARENVEHFVRAGSPIALPEGLPPELSRERAGVFVTIHKNGQLRGCIGTISPTTGSIAEEIIQNGVSSAAHDPRFEPIRPQELAELSYSVDVLMAPEDIQSADALDVKRYGVIVSSASRRGLLLPNLDGVDTVEEQVSIALRKGGISPNEAYSMQRFEVVRHQ